MYPKLFELSGGKDNLIQTLKDGQKKMQSEGTTIRFVILGDVTQLKESHSQEFAIVPETMEISMPKGTLKSESYLLGISDDGGKTWTFLDGAGMENLGDKIHTILPNLPADLELPKRKPPGFDPAPAKTTAAATQPATAPVTMEIERADYKLKVPRGCTVDPSDGKIDLDHLTNVNLPSGYTILIMVIDDKELAQVPFDKMTNSLLGKLKEPSEVASDLFKSRDGKGTVVAGKINGIQFCYEVGLFAGKQKAFIIMGSYEPSDSAETRQILRAVVDSFIIKE